MKFLIDAQLPRRLAHKLSEQGYDAIHTLDLPASNQTTDKEVSACSIREQRVVVTKDTDFAVDFLLKEKPFKLLLISTGNIANKDLEELLLHRLDQIVEILTTCDFVECDRTMLVAHDS